jgi:proteasome accessory factor C
MSGVSPEPLALELALARYVASMPEGSSIPLDELAEGFGCAVEDIGMALAPIVEVEDSYMTYLSWFVIEDGCLVKHITGGYEEDFRRPVRLSPAQVRAALLALDLTSDAVDPGMLAALRNKMHLAAGREVPEVEVGADFDEGIPIVAAIERACRERRVLEIRYPSEQRIKARSVEPLEISTIEGYPYLIAYCRFAELTRPFLLDRILSARITEEHFTERKDEAEQEDTEPRSHPPKRAVIRFSPEAASLLEQRPELDLVKEHEDGSADYALRYTDPEWAATRVMQHLGEAIVIEPEELREEVYRLALSLLEEYREGG